LKPILNKTRQQYYHLGQSGNFWKLQFIKLVI